MPISVRVYVHSSCFFHRLTPIHVHLCKQEPKCNRCYTDEAAEAAKAAARTAKTYNGPPPGPGKTFPDGPKNVFSFGNKGGAHVSSNTSSCLGCTWGMRCATLWHACV